MAVKARSPKTAGEIEAELRRVSILFADIQGSTELIQHLHPEAVADILDPAVRAMIEEVERFEGVISDRRGDGVMAIFGAPSAVEDHAVRACLAGLAIRDRMSLEAPEKIKVRVGIHFGEVVLRHGRMGPFRVQDAFGTAVYVAARLEQTAEPGSVCLSRTVYELARGFVHAVPLPSIQVKGISDPIDRMLLFDADQTANRWAVRAEKGLADFINRIEERQILADALEETEWKGLRLIQLFGPAGIGKSRIIHEFLSFDRVRHHYVVKFVGDHHRRHSEYHPVGNWLRSLLDIRSADSAHTAERKLNRMLDPLGIANEEPRRELKAMLGIGQDREQHVSVAGELRPLQLSGTFAEIVLRNSAQKSIILVCEDLDYFDSASYEFVNSLAEALSHRSRVLVLTTSRTRVHRRLVKARSSQSLRLSPFAEDHATELLTSLHSDFRKHPALTGAILNKAGGNPLFLEEVASLMIRSRKASRSGEEPLGPFGADVSSNIPDHVEALIADRLARLPKERRRLLQACAVVGVDVPLRLIAKLTGTPESELYGSFTKLQSEQVLFETRKYPDPQFTFKHSLIRDVAYNNLVPSVRREYHRKLVDILESEASEAHDRRLDDLCIHTIHAEAWSKAVKYLEMAAALAVERGSYESAEAFLNRALEISRTLSDDPETLRARIEVLLGLRSLAGANGKYLEANELLTEAEEIAHRQGDVDAQTRIMAHRAHVLNTLGDLDLAVELCELSRESARKLGNNQLLALATFFLGQAHFNLANFSAAEAAFGENERLILTESLPVPIGGLGTVSVLTYVTRAAVRAFQGHFGTAFRDVTQAKNYAMASNRPYDLSFAWFGEGFVRLQRSDAEAALAALHESMALAGARTVEQQSAGAASDLPAPPEVVAAQAENSAVQRVQTGMGHALLMKGDTGDAIARLMRAHEICCKHHRYMIQIWAATGLAFAHYVEGTDELALRYANEAVEMANRFGFNCFRIQALRARGLVRCGRPASSTAGLEDLGTALAAAQKLSMRGAVAYCHAAFVLAATGNASKHQDEASHMFKEFEMLPWWQHVLEANARGKRVYC
jgi:class 3 adenylate cyclase/tetratricopeptide (TPR) repeat protein/anti-anti-sigma regulatory factor